VIRKYAGMTEPLDRLCVGFQEESWERPEGGGGRSRVMKQGKRL
jgi:coproporphyrinogen III oxidase